MSNSAPRTIKAAIICGRIVLAAEKWHLKKQLALQNIDVDFSVSIPNADIAIFICPQTTDEQLLLQLSLEVEKPTSVVSFQRAQRDWIIANAPGADLYFSSDDLIASLKSERAELADVCEGATA